jgi:hypothetical protein
MKSPQPLFTQHSRYLAAMQNDWHNAMEVYLAGLMTYINENSEVIKMKLTVGNKMSLLAGSALLP